MITVHRHVRDNIRQCLPGYRITCCTARNLAKHGDLKSASGSGILNKTRNARAKAPQQRNFAWKRATFCIPQEFKGFTAVNGVNLRAPWFDPCAERHRQNHLLQSAHGNGPNPRLQRHRHHASARYPAGVIPPACISAQRAAAAARRSFLARQRSLCSDRRGSCALAMYRLRRYAEQARISRHDAGPD